MKGRKILIISLIVLAILIAIGYFFRDKIFKKGKKSRKENGDNTGTGGGGGGTPSDLVFGQSVAYASHDGTEVYKGDLNLYKTAKKHEWLGTIYGEKQNFLIPGKYDFNTNVPPAEPRYVDVYVLSGNDISEKYRRYVDKRDVCYATHIDDEYYANC